MYKERREYQRIIPPPGTYAIMDSSDNQIYPVLDISTEGIAFRYVATNGEADKPGQLDILVAGRGIGIDNLPCVEVMDTEIQAPQRSNSWEKRRASLRFQGLCDGKKRELGQFIKRIEGAKKGKR